MRVQLNECGMSMTSESDADAINDNKATKIADLAKAGYCHREAGDDRGCTRGQA